MTKAQATNAPSDQSAWDVPKVRRCLRCNAKFRSEWSGERVCSGCKSSNAWRNAVPVRSCPSGGRG